MHLYLICFITNFIFLYLSHWSTKKHTFLLDELKYANTPCRSQAETSADLSLS